METEARYKKITGEDVEFLRKVCSPDRVFFSDGISEDYSHDEMKEHGRYMPEVAIEPVDANEVSAVLRYANENNIPVTPRGSGTGLCGGAVAIHGGILISLARMNKILEIDKENLTATAEAGVRLEDLAAAVAEHELFYPPDPGEKSATLGGNSMTNAGGMRAVKYGVTRDYIRGMQAVLANGEIMELGGKVAKNSSGYSLKDLIIGSEGTLAIVTRLVLKLLPMPGKAASLLIPFADTDECIAAVSKLLNAKAVPTAVEFMQREVIEASEKFLGREFPDKSSDVYLLVSYDASTPEELDRVIEAAAELCLENNAADVFVLDKKDRLDAIWSTRSAFLEAIISSTPSLDECDVVVPRSRIAEFVKSVEAARKSFDIRILVFGHAGDGNLHAYVCKDGLGDGEWKTRVKKVMDELYAKAAGIGGQVSGEHGIGHAKIQYLEDSLGPGAVGLMKSIKLAFDPKDILNPGKVFK